LEERFLSFSPKNCPLSAFSPKLGKKSLFIDLKTGREYQIMTEVIHLCAVSDKLCFVGVLLTKDIDLKASEH